MTDTADAPDPEDMDADELEKKLREHPDRHLMFVTDDRSIHEMAVSEGELTYYETGTHGYDPGTSREILENLATEDVALKFVHVDRLLTERKELANGEWENIREWADDSHSGELMTDGGLTPSAVTYTLSDDADGVNELTPDFVGRFADRNPRLRLESATFRAMTDGTDDGIPAPDFPTPPEDVDTGGRGLYGKYVVLQDGEPQDGCFVLKPKSDPAAREALAAYADATEDAELGKALYEWLDSLDSEDPEPVTDGGTDIPEELDPDGLEAIPESELERYRDRRDLFTCPACGEVADARVESIGHIGQMMWKAWAEVHTDTVGDSKMVYFHMDEDAVDRGADLRALAAEHAPEDTTDCHICGEPIEGKQELSRDGPAHPECSTNFSGDIPMTDGGEPEDGIPLDDALQDMGVPESELERERERVADALAEQPRGDTAVTGDTQRVPITLRNSAFATVDSVEVCDGADGYECDRSSPVLIRGEDEIHITNYASAADRSGRRVLCGECRAKQSAVQIADDPELAALYPKELPDLRERFPDILGDVDFPVTDGGRPTCQSPREDCDRTSEGQYEFHSDRHGTGRMWLCSEHAPEDTPPVRTTPDSEHWTEQYDTTTYRGPQQYPVPGGWVLGMVEADGIGWKHYPDAGEGVSSDTDLMDEITDDEYSNPNAHAYLWSEFPEDADVLEDPPYHELKIDGEVVLVLKDASEVPEADWWRAIAKALARYDSGGEPGTVLSELGLEHLKADPFGASDDGDGADRDADRSLDEFSTGGERGGGA